MNTTSVWRGTVPVTNFPMLQGEMTADVVIVGGGITGVTLALNLAQQGTSVVLLEAYDVGFGSTGNSTGNLYETLSRGIFPIVDRWGSDVAVTVANARRTAVEQIDRRVRQFGIGCEFRRCSLYRYATSASGREPVEKEHQASLKAGLSVRVEETLPDVPIPPHGPVLILENQAQFHPQSYVRGLARQAENHGARLFESSAVLEMDTDRRVVHTADGKVTAREIVLATHTPKGFHLVQAEMIVNREYGIAAHIPGDSFPEGIFWTVGDERLSVRTADTGEGKFLICVGDEYKTGQHEAASSLNRLEASGRAHFDMREVAFQWSAQNYSAADGLPYIGRDASDCFIATGFETDGLTYGTLAASLIADQISGRENALTEIFKASRFSPVKGAKGMAEENVNVLKSLAKDYVTGGEAVQLSALALDSGAIVEIGKESVAAYRAPNGVLFTVSPVCTHMKCKVHWNDVETSWDCPCHGSRFAPDGKVIEGPAIKPLERKFLPE